MRGPQEDTEDIEEQTAHQAHWRDGVESRMRLQSARQVSAEGQLPRAEPARSSPGARGFARKSQEKERRNFKEAESVV